MGFKSTKNNSTKLKNVLNPLIEHNNNIAQACCDVKGSWPSFGHPRE